MCRSIVRLLLLVTQDFPKAAIDPGGIVHCVFDHAGPPLSIRIKLGLVQEIAGLHDGLDGIAEIVGEVPEFSSHIARQLLGTGNARVRDGLSSGRRVGSGQMRHAGLGHPLA